jgi:serine/threonine protein kinase
VRVHHSHATDSTERRLLEERVHAYQVVREIGRGGMGVVFLARDVMLHRLVAIKVLRHELSFCDEQRERFRREARVTARLSDDGIVAVHGFGEDDDLVYIVMEYVRGDALSARLTRSGATSALPHAEVRATLVSLARTLQHAHRSGIVHRDLKPENVLIDADSGRPMLTDFGVALSRSIDPLPSEASRAFGTPQFMSPEQAVGELDLDGRSDVYSLGVLGYLMLTGELPFKGSQFAQLASQHMVERPVGVRQKMADVPKDLASAIDRCLEKDPGERFQSAGELATVLEGRRTRSNPTMLVTRLGRVAVLAAIALGLSGK